MRISRQLAAGMMVVVAFFSANYSEAQQFASSSERRLFDAANRERGAQGLPALHWDEALANSARRHAREMAERHSISHQFPGELSLPARVTKAGLHFSAVAENVAEAPSASEVHRLWMNSTPHRANILDKDMDSIGIGVAERDGQLFAVEDFCRAR